MSSRSWRTAVAVALGLAAPLGVGAGFWAHSTDPMADRAPVVQQVASAGSSASRVRLIDCAHHARVKPQSFDIACGGDDAALSGTVWRGWGRPAAHGTGSFTVNDCTPDCAAGATRKYPVQVTAEDIAGPVGAHRYRTLVLTFPKAEPAGVRGHRSVVHLDSLRG